MLLQVEVKSLLTDWFLSSDQGPHRWMFVIIHWFPHKWNPFWVQTTIKSLLPLVTDHSQDGLKILWEVQHSKMFSVKCCIISKTNKWEMISLNIKNQQKLLWNVNQFFSKRFPCGDCIKSDSQAICLQHCVAGEDDLGHPGWSPASSTVAQRYWQPEPKASNEGLASHWTACDFRWCCFLDRYGVPCSSTVYIVDPSQPPPNYPV